MASICPDEAESFAVRTHITHIIVGCLMTLLNFALIPKNINLQIR